MPRGSSNFATTAFWLCLILLSIVFVLAMHGFKPPEALESNAPQDTFSAARARAELVRLLGDERPHPVGSDANKEVKARLIERLNELGLVPQIQDTIGCSAKRPTCGHVENVVARIDGEHESAVLLMAHYDSVPYAPGAGDDGAGVASLLEVARILRSEPRSHNSILFAFTDGEEAGLLGAEAFFAEHPWAKQVAVVVNLEGSGSSGPSILLRSGPESGVVLDTFRSVARYPVAWSFTEELFKRMPIDTDYSVSIRAGQPGLDFAFAGERNHYHTLRDTVANLSEATLQHHGDNVLPLVRALADADLSHVAPNYVYASMSRAVWLHYTPAAGLVVSIGVLIVLALATWRRWQGLSHFIGAFGIAALALVLIFGFTLAGLAAADLLAGTRVSWPANPWPWRMIIYAAPIVVLALLRPLVRRVGFWNTLLAPWWLWGLLVLVQTWWLPLASPLMLPATVLASVVIVLLAFVARFDRPTIRCAAAVINSVIAGYFLLPLVYLGEITQGFALAPVMFVPLALVAITLLPLLDRGRVKVAGWFALLMFIGGVTGSHWVQLYSEQRPQHINFIYAVDADAERARYAAWSPNALPAAISAAMPFTIDASVLPWQKDAMWSTAATSVEQRPSAQLEPIARNAATRTVRLRPASGTDVIGLAIPIEAPITAIRIEGRSVPIEVKSGENYRLVRFVAPPADGVIIEIDTTATDTIDAYLIDSSYSLPTSARLLTDARGVLAVPVKSGDGWVVYRRVKL